MQKNGLKSITYPLVMKKYELLRDLIENEMGVKLK